MDTKQIRSTIKDALVSGDAAHRLLELSEADLVIGLGVSRNTGESSEKREENQRIVRAALDVKLTSRSIEQTAALVDATAAFRVAMEAAAQAAKENSRQLEASRLVAGAAEGRLNRRHSFLMNALSAVAGAVITLALRG